MIRYGAEVLGERDRALGLEWLETNGLGGFASGTLAGAHTRRYHGLLVAASKPPLQRHVLLAKVEETLITPEAEFALGCNLYPDVVHPQGDRWLTEFRLDPWPVWRWRTDGGEVEKSICLIAGENTVLVRYSLTGAPGATLTVRPLLALRDYHATTHANAAFDTAVTCKEGAASLQPYPDLPALYFAFESATLCKTGDWYYRFQYPLEGKRGLDFEEDLFQPFELRFELTADAPVTLLVSTEPTGGRVIEELLAAEHARRLASSEDFDVVLARAARQFLIATGERTTVIAGYHWFTDWGRDTMIALPGLALGTGQTEVFRQVVLAFLPYFSQGLLPNRFPDGGAAPEYNSTDATLWFVEALRAYTAETADFAFVQEQCWSTLRDIVEWRERGTFFGIRVDTDGLLTGGAPGVQLTWMDAKVGDRVITERAGKPVEIQALWHNALLITADFAGRFGEEEFAAKCREMAARARRSFNEQFWNEAAGCLFDVVNGAERDGSIRPNQIFAFSLTHPVLEEPRRAAVLDVVTRELLTPFGLRTLSPRDARYRGRYEGDQAARDGAYHQGTVWPWLLGPYVDACRAAGRSLDVEAILAPFREHLREAGVGQVSEIFDGDAPHAPRGCIAQAWSVAELLRIARKNPA